MAGLACCLGVVAPVAGAAQRRPVFLSLRAAPVSLPYGGGTITISGRVRNATTCTLYDGFDRATTVRCSSGRFSFQRHVPANAGTVPAIWLPFVEAHSGRRHTRSSDVEVEVLPYVAPAPSVVNLDVCTAGPECDYGYAYESFPTWGNVAPDTLGDCTFAAAANWEQIVLGVHADPTVIGFEFAQAGGTEAGLAQTALWSYWQHTGIAGVKLTGLHRYFTDSNDVRNGVRAYGAMIVELRFAAGDGFAQYTVPASLHDTVVDGFTPEGPLVVSWGQTLQMTWEQWNAEATGMWGIGIG